MATFAQYKYDIWRAFAPDDEAVVGFAVPLAATTNGSTTTIRSTALLRGSAGTTHYNGRCVENLTNGDCSWVTDGGFDGTDQLTVSPAFTTTASADEFLVWPRGLSQALVEDEINNVLRNTEGPHFWVPSLVADADFDANAVDTYWGAVGGPTTRAFVTTVANILLGERALHIVAEAADDGAQSNLFNVTEGEQLLVSVTGQVATDSLVASLYDATATEDLESVTIDERLFTEMRFTEEIPADTHQARIRFLATAAGSDFYISPPVVVQSYAGRAYAAPSWLINRQMVEQALYLPAGFTSEISDSYLALVERAVPAPMPQFLQAERFATPLRLSFKASSRGPLALICHRTFAELSANTGTSTADREYVTAKAIANIKKRRKDGDWGVYATQAARAADRLHYGRPAGIIRENETMMV